MYLAAIFGVRGGTVHALLFFGRFTGTQTVLTFSGGATSGRARSNALAKKLLPWLAPWLTEIFTFGPSQSSQQYDRTDLEMTWLF